jgi:hypothetical protein
MLPPVVPPFWTIPQYWLFSNTPMTKYVPIFCLYPPSLDPRSRIPRHRGLHPLRLLVEAADVGLSEAQLQVSDEG